jgi:DNA-binding MarR family transcriptional regulator
VSHTSARQANLLAALSLAVTDRVTASAEDAAALGSAAPAALVALEQYLDGSSLDALRGVVGLTASGTVRLVDRLVAAGLVQRRPGADGRSRAVHLTSPGRRAARRVRDERAGAAGGALQVLTPAERATLERLHEKLLAGLTTDTASAGRLCRLCDAAACGHLEGRCPVTEAKSS